MTTYLPIKTTPEDLNVLAAYLRNQVGWTPLTTVKGTIPAKHADNRKIDAMKFIGLLDRDGTNVKLTDDGRRYAQATTPAEEADIVRPKLKTIPLFNQTLEWMYYQNQTSPTKTEVANYWHDKHASVVGELGKAALTDAAVFFLRMVGLAGLGKFVAAGARRDTHVKVDRNKLEAFVSGAAPKHEEAPVSETTPGPSPEPLPPDPRDIRTPEVTVGTGIHINVEIHVAPNAEPKTVEEMFRNMRKYVLGLPDLDENE